ncbi:lactonase family protein [Micromonospora sp. NPDC049679]|uniref:lactonase family protein n=1 Tax=Micromonospora sp. NPDC049679 TaxID=3155920 RepID=UPI0033DD56A0
MTDGEIIHIGCYTPEGGGRGGGIVAARRDPESGRLDLLGLAACTPSPSFLVRHPTLPVLYAVNEIEDGAVGAWTVTGEGELIPLGSRPTGGSHPCHVTVSPDGRHVISTNYGSGSLATHPIDDTGALGECSDLLAHEGHGVDPERQERPHPHMISPDPSGGSLLAVDLGTDSVYRYDLDGTAGRLVPYGARMWHRPGAGPRHLARHPDGAHCYLVGELDATLTWCEIDEAGVLHERGSIPASARAGHVQPSEVAVRADGRFLYVANRGPDTIAVFALDAGAPRYVGEVESGGRWPRHFALVGGHLYVANERSHSVGVFRIDDERGMPTALGAPVDTPSPTCIMPA